MEEYIKFSPNPGGVRFIRQPKDGRKSYRNRLKVEKTFSRYKRIIDNKFKTQYFLSQQKEAKLSLLILYKMNGI